MQPHYDITQKTINHMAAEPSQDAIRQVLDILPLTAQDAALLLRNHANDIPRSIDAYFNDSVAALREQPDPRSWEAQDNVPFEDDSSTGALPATRPPSRVDNKIADLSHIHQQANAAVEKSMQDDDMNDPEFQRAIKLSLGQPEMPEQENGVTGTGQQFGPATRSHYESNEWAVVPVATSRELVDHPPASKRQRIEGQPAFLRPSKDTGYLAALLTIYHSIPLAREAFLLPSMRIHNYGSDNTWWSGSTDENQKALSMETDLSADKNKINLLVETQCLMAFLDNTRRAYGGVDALANLDAMRDYRSPASTQFSTFVEAWKDAALSQLPEEQLSQVFTSVAVKNMDPDPPLQRDMVCIESHVNRIPGQKLLNLLDNTVWDDTADQIEDVCLSHVSEIFTFRLYDTAQQPEGLDLAVPAVWYPDRYTWGLREQTKVMRAQIQSINKGLTQLLFQQRRLGSFMIDGRPIRAREVLEAAAQSSTTALEERYNGHKPSDELWSTDMSSIAGHIQAVLKRVEEKIAEMEEKRSSLRAEIQKITLQYSEPGDDPNEPPFMKYVLQGLATKPEIMYVRERSQDLLGLENDSDEERNEYQWWRIQWLQVPGSGITQPRPPLIGPVTQAQATNSNGDWSAKQGDQPYSVTRVKEEDVLEAARTEHHSIVLVYANENAMSFEGSAISQPLKQFVDLDNKHFANELREELDEQDVSHMAWDDVSVKEGVTIQPDREMTPMSTTTHRGEDGQPSPKRPRSSDDSWKPDDDGLPSYDQAVTSPVQMQENSHTDNKIGLYAEAMLEKYGNGDSNAADEPQTGEAVHIERAPNLPR
jgi:hypothetical protein